jgi:hypothetical protein
MKEGSAGKSGQTAWFVTSASKEKESVMGMAEVKPEGIIDAVPQESALLMCNECGGAKRVWLENCTHCRDPEVNWYEKRIAWLEGKVAEQDQYIRKQADLLNGGKPQLVCPMVYIGTRCGGILKYLGREETTKGIFGGVDDNYVTEGYECYACKARVHRSFKWQEVKKVAKV